MACVVEAVTKAWIMNLNVIFILTSIPGSRTWQTRIPSFGGWEMLLINCKIVIFPNAIPRCKGEKLTVDLLPDGNGLAIDYCGEKQQIRFDALENQTSTIYVVGQSGSMALFNFRELLMTFGMTPTQFLEAFHLRGFIQIDKTRRGVFTKIFCFKGCRDPDSTVTDWRRYDHEKNEDLHYVDRKYSWAFIPYRIRKENGRLVVTGRLWKSELWQDEPLYFNHGGQAVLLDPGVNHINMVYVPGEQAYVGNIRSRYVGRMIDLGAKKWTKF